MILRPKSQSLGLKQALTQLQSICKFCLQRFIIYLKEGGQGGCDTKNAILNSIKKGCSITTLLSMGKLDLPSTSFSRANFGCFYRFIGCLMPLYWLLPERPTLGTLADHGAKIVQPDKRSPSFAAGNSHSSSSSTEVSVCQEIIYCLQRPRDCLKLTAKTFGVFVVVFVALLKPADSIIHNRRRGQQFKFAQSYSLANMFTIAHFKHGAYYQPN